MTDAEKVAKLRAALLAAPEPSFCQMNGFAFCNAVDAVAHDCPREWWLEARLDALIETAETPQDEADAGVAVMEAEIAKGGTR